LSLEIVGSRWSFGPFKIQPFQSLLNFWLDLHMEFFKCAGKTGKE